MGAVGSTASSDERVAAALRLYSPYHRRLDVKKHGLVTALNDRSAYYSHAYQSHSQSQSQSHTQYQPLRSKPVATLTAPLTASVQRPATAVTGATTTTTVPATSSSADFYFGGVISRSNIHAIECCELITIYGRALERWVQHHTIRRHKQSIVRMIGFGVAGISGLLLCRWLVRRTFASPDSSSTTPAVGAVTARTSQPGYLWWIDRGLLTLAVGALTCLAVWAYRNSVVHSLFRLATPPLPDTASVETAAAQAVAKAKLLSDSVNARERAIEAAAAVVAAPTVSVGGEVVGSASPNPFVLVTAAAAANTSPDILSEAEPSVAVAAAAAGNKSSDTASSPLDQLLSVTREISTTLTTSSRPKSASPAASVSPVSQSCSDEVMVEVDVIQRLNRIPDLYSLCEPNLAAPAPATFIANR